jgi:hypothetical protein
MGRSNRCRDIGTGSRFGQVPTLIALPIANAQTILSTLRSRRFRPKHTANKENPAFSFDWSLLPKSSLHQRSCNGKSFESLFRLLES